VTPCNTFLLYEWKWVWIIKLGNTITITLYHRNHYFVTPNTLLCNNVTAILHHFNCYFVTLGMLHVWRLDVGFEARKHQIRPSVPLVLLLCNATIISLPQRSALSCIKHHIRWLMTSHPLHTNITSLTLKHSTATHRCRLPCGP
jgi:hypothetical protein